MAFEGRLYLYLRVGVQADKKQQLSHFHKMLGFLLKICGIGKQGKLNSVEFSCWLFSQ
jgi:hypothetical protein